MAFLGENYWTERYSNGKTGWDIGFASPPLVQYLDQIANRDLEGLIPGAGSGYEAGYAKHSGLCNFHLLDFSEEPLNRFKASNPDFPADNIHQEDFFLHQGKYDLILEQTFFCALDPILRADYASKMQSLLKPGGKLVGVWFDREFEFQGPPFGGDAEEYRSLFEKYFVIKTFAPCYNSIPERLGAEVFMILENSKI
ncbi:thiopurine S-methyltransferase [Algoriphagus ratkowskyi]|uniref:Methyltransferase domain-containing protein n=1 Tax=Algoriphagus ratkowskyi TaxID=57028 RepID=A0A2W7RJ50_9BACT|nr:methyltransferase domain-containing protein [Algoriphagus ratkowskyi]PZX60414.1 thiopurine S-methyltransferase [Algoriphagus ratkowskyi]TXD78225.1 methyltransferase domain-containing protein [Algoriphagus ratkowskyi]